MSGPFRRETITAMNISGSFPINAARAYGVGPTRPPVIANRAAPLARIDPAPQTGAAHDVWKPAAAPTSNVEQLVGGQVDGPVFGSTPAPTPRVTPGTPGTPGTYQLYTRAADKVEAATGVQVGRSIDVKG